MAIYFRPNRVLLLTTVLLFSDSWVEGFNRLICSRSAFSQSAYAASDETDATSSSDLKDDILSIVEKRHPSHDDAATIKSFGNKAIPILIEIFNSTTSNVTKTRVLEVISHFEDDRVRSFIENELKTNSNGSLKGTVLENIAFTYGAPLNLSKANEDLVMDIIEPYLDSENPDLRLSAARGLGIIPTARSLMRLQSFLDKETKKSVHDQANRIVEKLQKRLHSKDEATSTRSDPNLESKLLLTKQELQKIVGIYEGLFVGGLFLGSDLNQGTSAKPYYTPNLIGVIRAIQPSEKPNSPSSPNSTTNSKSSQNSTNSQNLVKGSSIGSSTQSVTPTANFIAFTAGFSITPKPLPKSDFELVISFDTSTGLGQSVLKLPEIYLADGKLSNSMSRILPKSPSFTAAPKAKSVDHAPIEIPIKILAWSKVIQDKTRIHLEFRNQYDETLFSFRQVNSN